MNDSRMVLHLGLVDTIDVVQDGLLAVFGDRAELLDERRISFDAAVAAFQ